MSEKTVAPKKKAPQKKKKETAPLTPPKKELSAVPDDAIFIKGARMHNLKNVDVAIPRNKLVVVTGVSGSGKSSLTMDTLFAEGQRRYAESLSAYARQFLARMDKPDVDYIRGICPAIAIEQKVTSRTPRSTVGSMTEIGDYLRLLFARVGRTYSPISGEEVRKDTVSDVVTAIQNQPHGSRVYILSPLFTRYGRSLPEELNILLQKGFTRVYNPKTGMVRIEDLIGPLPTPADVVEQSVSPIGMTDIVVNELPEETKAFWLQKSKASKASKSAKPMWQHDAYLLLDRLVVKDFDEDDLHRIADSVQTAFYESDGDCFVECLPPVGLPPTLGLPPTPSEGGGVPENASGTSAVTLPPRGRAGDGANGDGANGADEAFHGLNSADPHAYKRMKEFVKSMRTKPTKAEEVLWKALRGKQFEGEKFRRQHVLGRYIADFVDLDKRLVIELDGLIHQLPDNMESDAIRTAWLTEKGFLVLRFSNENVLKNLEGTLGKIGAALKERPSLGLLTPGLPPAPSGGGGVPENVGASPTPPREGLPPENASGTSAVTLPLRGRAGDGADGTAKMHHFNSRFEKDDITFEEPTPNLFSPNNPLGACPTCEGFGMILGIDPDLVIPDKRLSVYEGAVAPWKGEKMGLWKDDFVRQGAKMDFPVHKPVMDLTPKEYDLLWNGGGRVQGIKDFFQMVSENLYKIQYRIMQARYRGRTLCPDCGGSRLRKEALYVKISGATIADLLRLPVTDLAHWFQNMQLSEAEQQIAKRILIEINQRLKTLLDVGLGYLTLSRTANTLSGGESQRIQLTKFLGSNLTDSLYILDEPSIGLHPRDTARLIGVLKNLRDLGNTVVVVEHDEMMMREADHIIDMGPLASYLGGEVVAEGDYDAIISNPKSLTGQYLSGALQIEVPKKKRKAKGALHLEGARQHNLKDITVDIPLGVLTVVSGISGSGKTTLIKGTLFPALQKHFGTGTDKPGLHRALTGDIGLIDGVELVDQNPIGKSSRSNPVTYVKAWDEIRKLFEKQPLAKMRGYEGKHFSFNTDGGRCDTCKGEGEVVVEMQFLADVHLLCESCKGRRFKDEVLEVTYGTKNVFDVLEMSVDEALEFFRDEKKIVKALKPLSNVGLGYIKLGQSSDTLSGGEAQRVKLATFLGQGASKQKVLFIFDEPTTGLHFNDIKKLLQSFNALIDEGHSILVIEHNTDVIKSADWVIDLGPEGGEGGGYLIYEGAPEGMKDVKESATGGYL